MRVVGSKWTWAVGIGVASVCCVVGMHYVLASQWYLARAMSSGNSQMLGAAVDRAPANSVGLLLQGLDDSKPTMFRDVAYVVPRFVRRHPQTEEVVARRLCQVVAQSSLQEMREAALSAVSMMEIGSGSDAVKLDGMRSDAAIAALEVEHGLSTAYVALHMLVRICRRRGSNEQLCMNRRVVGAVATELLGGVTAEVTLGEEVTRMLRECPP